MAVVRRVYVYGIAFLALGMLVSGLDGLLASAWLALAAGLVPPITVLDGGEARARISLAVALAVIGLITWLAHWLPAERLVRAPGERGLEERQSAIRKLFLAAILLIGGIIGALAFGHLIRDTLLALAGRLPASDVLTGDLSRPAATLAITGVFWLYYRQIADRDRRIAPEIGAGATLRRWFVYGLSFFGLLIALFAAADLLAALWEIVLPRPAAVTIGRDWPAPYLAGRAGTLAAGATVWVLAWRSSTRQLGQVNDPDPETRSVLRKVYLYLVLAIVVAWSVWNLGQILYGLLRLVLIPEDASAGPAGVLARLGPPLARVLVFGLAWIYHARAVEREATIAAERRQQATIRWTYQYLAALVGLITFAVGLIGTGSTVIDLVVQPGATRPTDWWQDRISLFATLALVGLPLWLAYRRRLQGELTALARGSISRRIYLFLSVGLGVVAILGSGAFALYQVIRLALGASWSAGQTTELLGAAATVAVVGVLLAYHVQIFQRDAAAAAPAEPAPELASGAPPAGEPQLVDVLIRVPNEAVWREIRQALLDRAASGVTVEVRSIHPAPARNPD